MCCLYMTYVCLPVKVHYIPGKDRMRSYHLEVVFRLRAKSVTRISLAFDRAFLKWTEYPPDANHGFYVNSAVLTTVLPVAYNYTAVQQNASVFEERYLGHCCNIDSLLLLSHRCSSPEI